MHVSLCVCVCALSLHLQKCKVTFENVCNICKLPLPSLAAPGLGTLPPPHPSPGCGTGSIWKQKTTKLFISMKQKFPGERSFTGFFIEVPQGRSRGVPGGLCPGQGSGPGASTAVGTVVTPLPFLLHLGSWFWGEGTRPRAPLPAGGPAGGGVRMF